jgi:hypothetical protein
MDELKHSALNGHVVFLQLSMVLVALPYYGDGKNVSVHRNNIFEKNNSLKLLACMIFWKKLMSKSTLNLPCITRFAHVPVLKHCDVKKPVLISTDASKNGIGALPLQDCQPVACASIVMTETETH